MKIKYPWEEFQKPETNKSVEHENQPETSEGALENNKSENADLSVSENYEFDIKDIDSCDQLLRSAIDMFADVRRVREKLGYDYTVGKERRTTEVKGNFPFQMGMSAFRKHYREAVEKMENGDELSLDEKEELIRVYNKLVHLHQLVIDDAKEKGLDIKIKDENFKQTDPVLEQQETLKETEPTQEKNKFAIREAIRNDYKSWLSAKRSFEDTERRVYQTNTKLRKFFGLKPKDFEKIVEEARQRYVEARANYCERLNMSLPKYFAPENSSVEGMENWAQKTRAKFFEKFVRRPIAERLSMQRKEALEGRGKRWAENFKEWQKNHKVAMSIGAATVFGSTAMMTGGASVLPGLAGIGAGLAGRWTADKAFTNFLVSKKERALKDSITYGERTFNSIKIDRLETELLEETNDLEKAKRIRSYGSKVAGITAAAAAGYGVRNFGAESTPVQIDTDTDTETLVTPESASEEVSKGAVTENPDLPTEPEIAEPITPEEPVVEEPVYEEVVPDNDEEVLPEEEIETEEYSGEIEHDDDPDYPHMYTQEAALSDKFFQETVKAINEQPHYLANKGDTFYEICSGETKASYPPTTDWLHNYGPEQIKDLIDDTIRTANHDTLLLQTMGFGSHAGKLNIGAAVDMRLMERLLNEVALAKGLDVPNTSEMVPIPEPLATRITELVEAMDFKQEMPSVPEYEPKIPAPTNGRYPDGSINL